MVIGGRRKTSLAMATSCRMAASRITMLRRTRPANSATSSRWLQERGSRLSVSSSLVVRAAGAAGVDPKD
jgi:hypothetical protein